jgi:argininosuccinate synthase
VSKIDSVFDTSFATIDDYCGDYNLADVGGFIKLNALRMRIAANLKNERETKAAARKTPAKKKA